MKNKFYIFAHYIVDNKKQHQQSICYAPRVGDELRFSGNVFFKVVRLVWPMDEDDDHTRLNIELERIGEEEN